LPLVTATLMNGRALAERVRAEVAEEVRALGHVGLATVLVGDDPASDVYIRAKHRAAEEVGIATRDVRLPETSSEEELLALLGELNADEDVDAVLVQLPLPDGIDPARAARAVAPRKDVDGLHPLNGGHLFAGTPTFVGATPLGIMALLAEYEAQLLGARAVVVGRSQIVGKPTALLLLGEHATVTICHSRTRDLAGVVREADVVVAGVGRAGVITAEMVKPGAAVVDVGVNRTDEGLLGDVDPGVAEVAGLLTPVPGGVGPMTIAMLLRNAVRAARYRAGLLAYPET
jgi:methylenetetrahydrofolate dehydrogenase (NADP+) / methenyltetrahydrofolate cyclohydrolase